MNRDNEFASQSLHDLNRDENSLLIQYFSEIFSSMKEGFKNDGGKGYIVDNVLEQTIGKEVELSCNHLTSHCIETLLEDCSNPYVIIRFLEAFSRNLNIVCIDQCGSHIVEKLLQISLQIVKNLPSLTEQCDMEEKENIKTACLFWAHKLGQFCCQNLELCLNDTYGCHVLSAIIQFLGCCQIDEVASHSKKLYAKVQTSGKSGGHGNSYGMRDACSSVPQIFLNLLKEMGMKIVECNHLSDLIFDSKSSHVIQILLLVLKKKNLECFEIIKQILLSIIFSRRNHEGVPVALCDRNCSYVVEKLVELSNEDEQELLWMEINRCLPQLILHPIGNYIIQNFFYSVHSKQFESIFDATVHHFEDILKSRHFGIWLSIAKSCNRLKMRQVQFLTTIMQVLKCSEPIERNSSFVVALLGIDTCKREKKKMSVASKQLSCLTIDLFGSLILQEILKFSKPFKVVRSILSMSPEMLKTVACEKQGCHVFISFLESTSIARKDKERLLQQLKPAIAAIACDCIGNLTLCRMWSLLSMEHKLIIAKQLCKKKCVLQQHKCGAAILKKFAIFHVEHDTKKWKEIQQLWEKKQQMFKEVIS